MSGVEPVGRRTAPVEFANALKELCNRATGPELSQAEICRAEGMNPRTVSAWLNGRQVPTQDSWPAAQRLISRMEKLAAWSARSAEEWERLWQRARAHGDLRQGGRPGNSYRPTPALPFRLIHDPALSRLKKLSGRDTELEQLRELVVGGTHYVSLVAPAWSGKSEFLTHFAKDYAPPEVDLIGYFVRWGKGSDTAGNFVATMCGALRRYLKHLGKTNTGPKDKDKVALLELYETVSEQCMKEDRILVLLVDGLDEDAGTWGTEAPVKETSSIASMLPPEPYPGLVVLVSRRPHPPLPIGFPHDHPLRDAEPVVDFRPSPEAAEIAAKNEAALEDLDALLSGHDSWQRDVVGLLAVAEGGLTEQDLLYLVQGGGCEIIPHDLARLLRSVASRSFSREELEPDALVLAHRDLHRQACESLGQKKLARLREGFRGWADEFRAKGWPADTPGYLLHGYLGLLEREAAERRKNFTLDHRRLARLAARGRTDLALASLDWITSPERTGPEKPTLADLASAAASRALLEAGNTLIPREVLRALCVVDDGERARALALGAGDPASKAVRLLDVVRELLATRLPGASEQARNFAWEAAMWAVRSDEGASWSPPVAEWETVAVVPQAVVALAEAGRTDGGRDGAALTAEAVRLLERVDIRRSENVEPVARAAALLCEAAPDLAARVLDELLLEADHQAENGKPVLAVEIMASVAVNDPERRKSLLEKIEKFSERLAVDSHGLVAVDCRAVVVSALARVLEEVTSEDERGKLRYRTRELAKTAWSEARAISETVSGDDFGASLALLAQASCDLEELPEAVRGRLGEFPAHITARGRAVVDQDQRKKNRQPAEPDPADGGAKEPPEVRQERDLLRQVAQSRSLGDRARLRRDVDQYLQVVAEREADLPWLPHLAEALAGLPGDTGSALARLTGKAHGALPGVRLMTAAARGHADAGRRVEALRCAVQAAALAERVSPQPPEMRASVAQAFAYAGEADTAESWAGPPDGRRPRGRAGLQYRRAALAVDAELDPAAIGGLLGAGPLGVESDLLEALRRLASGESVDARLASLRTTAYARLTTEPLLATGLALLHAARGEVASAIRVADDIPDPTARGVAQVTVAGYLQGAPTHLDAAGDEDRWKLSVLRVLAHRLCPVTETVSVHELVGGILRTESWYRALPLLGRIDPRSVAGVVDVLDHHGRVLTDLHPNPHAAQE